MTDTASARKVWPRRLRRAEAARYLCEVHGIPIEEKTLANRSARGDGPRPVYLGTLPYYETAALDAWAETAFTQESPVTTTRRRAAALARRLDEKLTTYAADTDNLPSATQAEDTNA